MDTTSSSSYSNSMNGSGGGDSSNGDKTFASNKENTITITVLFLLASIYVYLLLSPLQPHLPSKPRSFVLQRDTKAAYTLFYEDYKKNQYSYYEPGSSSSGKDSNYSYSGSNYKEFGKSGEADDFFMDTNRNDYTSGGREKHIDEKKNEPNVPSDKFRCQVGWLTIRAELNYKYLWMHTGENGWMGASATLDTPLHRRAYEVVPVNESCEGGWVMLREGDSKGFLMMVAPTGGDELDEWVVKIGKSNDTVIDQQYHFLLEEEGYLLNRGSMAFLNVMPEAEYSIRGHTGGWDRTKAAGREYGAMMHFNFLNSSLVEAAIEKELGEIKESEEEDKVYIAQIAAFPKSDEKRVVSFGLYGAKEKYTAGAVHNMELASTYFPGWICRYYITSDVPEEIVLHLKALGAEIEQVPAGMGYSSGMFWRFMVAADASVDRFIVRDVDSRLNARDRIAVEAWIDSKYPVHILRDHVNHCIPMNGGMW
eukprot:CAMPEP_0119035306 /NCGR_PEP_ID=MMETSP1177-20130426/2235_1 /TAXON_ID=2985 /ORGANISM="Ochromonas sp, Strain CCMP1899" /LENGTH=478 /DNA_ID=CAMNT_0006993353 /DNA_START=161 /DNA_END=1594 /DNA_ORIENTATION=+